MNKEDIDFLISIQDLEQPDFDNACLKRENKRLNKEIDRLNNIINELEKWLDDYYKSNRKWYSTELSSHDRQYYESEYRNTEFMIVKVLKQLKELKEENK